MQRVYTAVTLVDAQLVSDLLAENHIDCDIFNKNSVGGLGELPTSHPEIWVRDCHVEYAQSLITDYERTAISDDIKLCPNCDEKNPQNFAICWQCHQPISPRESDAVGDKKN